MYEIYGLDGLKRVATLILLQAADDYRAAILREMNALSDREKLYARKGIEELEEWFRSPYAERLAFCAGEGISVQVVFRTITTETAKSLPQFIFL